MSEENLFRKLLLLDEKILVPIGIWPTNDWKFTMWNYFHIFIQLGFFILVVFKNLLNPEKGSVENALILANGGLIIVIYCITVLIKKDKFVELIDYMKVKSKSKVRPQERKFLINIGQEFQKIARGSLLVLAAACLLRFILPPIEIFYYELFDNDKIYKIPPAMGFPAYNILSLDILVYIVETFIRLLILAHLVGICSIFILTTLYISYKFFSLALNLEFFDQNDVNAVNGFIIEHNKIIR
ncbi:hypothetical protein PVAND_016263 [Polypedilum vanderplanki]|uniref:Odorant receptor n=1 Tax=Polypedilum vanderplanki TaxID=319348 RepID=A0A9J6BFD3_POLVA|nr:hypothetical protein PVAND_016263 [Polypedilum vanderplanki]